MHLNYLGITLLLSGATALWQIYLTHRQRRRTYAIKPEVMEKIKEVLKMTDEEIAKSQAYQKDRLLFSIITDGIDFLKNFGLLYTRFFPYVWNLVPSIINISVGGYIHGLIYCISTDLFITIISLPEDFYSTFVIEEKHGFNKQTILLWVKDNLLSFFLRASLYHPITTALFHYVVKYFGLSFPNYLFCGGLFLLIIFMYIFPTFIQPLFNKYTPLLDGTLKEKIEKFANDIKFPLKKIFVVDGSKRSAHSNAYFYGFYNNKRIVIFDTLLKDLNEDEVLAVLGHEFGHWYHSHNIQMLGIGVVQLFFICHALKMMLFEPKLATDFGFGANALIPGSVPLQINPILGFQLLSMVFLAPISNILTVFMNNLSRRNEFQADNFAIKKELGENLFTALTKISKENKGCVDPDWLYSACNYSHPPIILRLREIEEKITKQK